MSAQNVSLWKKALRCGRSDIPRRGRVAPSAVGEGATTSPPPETVAEDGRSGDTGILRGLQERSGCRRHVAVSREHVYRVDVISDPALPGGKAVHHARHDGECLEFLHRRALVVVVVGTLACVRAGGNGALERVERVLTRERAAHLE